MALPPASPRRSFAASSSSRTATPQDIESQTPKETRLRFLYDQVGLNSRVLSHPYRGHGTPESPYIVDFLPNDPRNPTTFSPSTKWTITLINAIATLAVTFASSAYAGAITDIITSFRVSQTVAILGVSLFVLGFAVGPLLWAPLSEIFGRQRLFLGTFAAMTAFLAASAGAQDVETLLVLRFFAGAFGSSPLTNAAGVIADMFCAEERGAAGALFAVAPFLGPTLGPIAGGFLGHASGWRWVQAMIALFTTTVLFSALLTIPETYAPYLLRRRAAALSKATGKTYKSKLDHSSSSSSTSPTSTSFSPSRRTTLLRPWILLFREPIVFLTSIYMAIIYGTLYMLFAAFPIVFQINRGWEPGPGGLAFIGVAIGMILAVTYAWHDNKRYVALSRALASSSSSSSSSSTTSSSTTPTPPILTTPPPEARLPPAILGSILLPIGLFWFAWTSTPSIHWIVPILASTLFGAGLVLVFLSLFIYLVDAYSVFAASALAANSVIRSLFGAAFPLFAPDMYAALGVRWAGSVPAFLALACLPFPFLFWRFGAGIRARCRYAREAEELMARLRSGAGKEVGVAEEGVFAGVVEGGGRGEGEVEGGGRPRHEEEK